MEQLAATTRKSKWPTARWREILAAMAPFARRHRIHFIFGAIASLAMIGVRLSLPWLFKAMLKPLLSGNHNHKRLAHWLSDGSIEPTLLFGGIFLVLLVLLGFADFLARLQFAKFAIGTVRDLRASAFAAALQIDPRIRASGAGDLVARLIGDTARVKEGMKGFLIHVATSGMLLLGISVTLLWVQPYLGAIVATAFLAIAIVTFYGTVCVYRKASKYRSKEGKLAEKIHAAWRRSVADDSFAAVNQESGEHEANVTKLQGRTTWAAHAIFGTAVLLIVWLGMRAVSTRALPTGDMLLFIMYSLMMRSPIVQLTRQGTRTGKIFACADRLEQILKQGEPPAVVEPLQPLGTALCIDNVKIRRPKSQGRVRRLYIPHLQFRAGTRTAIIGGAGSGKTTLLQVMSGRIELKRGAVTWDGRNLQNLPQATRDIQLKHLPQNPDWVKQPLWRVLGLPDAQPTPEQRLLIRKSGAKLLLKRLPKGLSQALASEAMSPGEAKSLGLARLFIEGGSVFLLDEPGYGLSKKKAAKRIRQALDFRPGSTLIVAMARIAEPQVFDRIIELRNGKIIFDGNAQAYLAREAQFAEIDSQKPVLAAQADKEVL